MRITAEIMNDVLRLLRQPEQSQRSVARATGVSRATVAKIASGRFRPFVPREGNDHDSWRPTGPIGRCPTCGGRVYLPCRLCKVRTLKSQEGERRRRPHAPPAGPRQPSRPWGARKEAV